MAYKCGKCGRNVADDASFCPSCGTKIEKYTEREMAIGCGLVGLLLIIYLVVEYWRYILPVIVPLIGGGIYYLLTKGKKDQAKRIKEAERRQRENSARVHTIQKQDSAVTKSLALDSVVPSEIVADESSMPNDEEFVVTEWQDDEVRRATLATNKVVVDVLHELANEPVVIEHLPEPEMEDEESDVGVNGIDHRLWTMFVGDIVCLYRKLGCKVSDLRNKEGLAIIFLYASQHVDNESTYVEVLRNDELISATETGLSEAFASHNEFLLRRYLVQVCNRPDLDTKYAVALNQWGQFVVAARGNVTKVGERVLQSLLRQWAPKRQNGKTTRKSGGTNNKGWRDFVSESIAAADSILDVMKEIDGDGFCREQWGRFKCLDEYVPDECESATRFRLWLLIAGDITNIVKKLGYDLGNTENRETFAYGYISAAGYRLSKDGEETLPGVKRALILPSGKQLLKNIVEMAPSAFDLYSSFVDVLEEEEKTRNTKFYSVVMALLAICRPELATQYATSLYRWASVVAKADGVITDIEADTLASIMESLNVTSDLAVDETRNRGETASVPSETVQYDNGDPMDELNSLIGLGPVKEDVSALANFVKIQKQRSAAGMKTAPVSYHCVFTGSPGTGKTTVARIIARIYRNMGILSKGQLVETDRSGLVAEYVGQTAAKTNAIIDKALDGVLFIDEAYTLVQGGSGDYGMEAIGTLLKRMEDDRNRLVVILAGYGDEMKKFIDANPGLQSRFNRYIDFPDYSASELIQIFMALVRKNEYECDGKLATALLHIMEEAVKGKDRNFGNARFVRNLFEKCIQRQAIRLSSVAPITNEMLRTLTESDIT